MTTLDDLWSMVCLGGVLLAFVGFLVAAAFAIAQELRQAKQASNARDDDGEPRDVPEDAPVYELRLDSAVGASLPGGVAAWLIAETQAERMARQQGTNHGTGGVR